MRRCRLVLRKLREARVARDASTIAWMYQSYPWFRDFAVFRPGREWQAVHLPSGTVLPPAKTPRELHALILADVQSRPLPARDCDAPDDRTRLDIRIARPYSEGPPRGGGRL